MIVSSRFASKDGTHLPDFHALRSDSMKGSGTVSQAHHHKVCVNAPGWVRTDMTSHSGLIDPTESVRGLLSVIEKEGASLNGRMFDYKHEEIPW